MSIKDRTVSLIVVMSIYCFSSLNKIIQKISLQQTRRKERAVVERKGKEIYWRCYNSEYSFFPYEEGPGNFTVNDQTSTALNQVLQC